MPKLRKNLGLAVDERRQDERGDNETDQLHDDRHWHRLACDARERLAETALVAEVTTWGIRCSATITKPEAFNFRC